MPQKIKRKGHFILTTSTPPLWVHFFKLTIPQRKTGQKYQHSPPFRNSTFFLKPLRKNNFETPLRKSYHGWGEGVDITWNGPYQNESADTAFFPSEISIQDFLRKFI